MARRTVRLPPWLAPLLLAGGGAVIAALELQPSLNRGLWESGALYLALTSDRALPMIGLGCALGQVGRRWSAPAALLLAVGTGAGFFGEPWLVSVAGGSPPLWTLLRLATGPLGGLVAGIALAVPGRVRGGILLPAALVIGAQLGLAVTLNGPGLDDGEFTGAAIGTALWLTVAVALTWRRFERPWFGIAGRIFGSWLIAIGLMLGGAVLTPRHTPRQSAISPPPLSAYVEKAPHPWPAASGMAVRHHQFPFSG